MWCKGGKEAGSSGTEGEVLLVQKEGTQEVGMSGREREENKGRGSTTMQSVEEGEMSQTLFSQ